MAGKAVRFAITLHQKRKAESEQPPRLRAIRSHSGGSYRLLTLSARQQLDENSVFREVDFVVGIVLFEVDAVQFRHFQKSHEHRDHLSL